MNSQLILDRLQAELGFAPELVGGRDMVLAQIERFLAREQAARDLDIIEDSVRWNRLISEIIVPETSFFRYSESFAALREWLAAHPAKSLRILCLPCSTGEEAYSVAITLREAGVPRFHIDACDVSAHSVATARAGSYSGRAQRGLAEATRDKWFPGNLAESSIRDPIHFQVANVFSFDAAPQSYDILFCRNLLIYFDTSNQRHIFERIERWLAPGGILFLGPGEATVAASYGWKGTGQQMSFSFERAAGIPAPAPAAARPPAKFTKPAPIPPCRREPAIPQVSTPALDALDVASSLADAGRLDEASLALKQFHEREEPNTRSLILHGILEEARGNRETAEASYRKALYLDPDQLDALLHLSLLLETEGRARAAVPFRRRVERLISAS